MAIEIVSFPINSMVDLSSSFSVNVYQRVAVFWLLIQYYTILYQYYTIFLI